MIFDPDMTKELQEAIFSRNISKEVHPNLTLYNSQVRQTESQKHLGLVLDNKLNFNKHLKGVLDKISKTMGFICKFNLFFQDFHCSLFIKLSLDHILIMETIYDQTYNA